MVVLSKGSESRAGCRQDAEKDGLGGGLAEKATEARVKGGQEGSVYKLLTKHKVAVQRARAPGQ